MDNKFKNLQDSNLFEKIRLIVSQIPEGMVSTYGSIGKALGIDDARKVGWAMAGTTDPKVPCHRVVTKDGKLSNSFGINGWEEQRALLEAEGVTFIKDRYVNLEEHLWLPNTNL